jgi:hypothetical protein
MPRLSIVDFTERGVSHAFSRVWRNGRSGKRSFKHGRLIVVQFQTLHTNFTLPSTTVVLTGVRS